MVFKINFTWEKGGVLWESGGVIRFGGWNMRGKEMVGVKQHRRLAQQPGGTASIGGDLHGWIWREGLSHNWVVRELWANSPGLGKKKKKQLWATTAFTWLSFTPLGSGFGFTKYHTHTAALWFFFYFLFFDEITSIILYYYNIVTWKSQINYEKHFWDEL